MIKLVALFKKPADAESFDQHYANVHTPLIRAMPGLQRLEVSRITSTIGGESPFYLIASMYFNGEDELNAALASPQGKAAGKDLMGFAKGIVSLLVAEVTE